MWWLYNTATSILEKGGATTATTYIRPYKQAAGMSAAQTMEERFA